MVSLMMKRRGSVGLLLGCSYFLSREESWVVQQWSPICSLLFAFYCGAGDQSFVMYSRDLFLDVETWR